MRIPAVPPPVVCVQVGVHLQGVNVSTVGVMNDVSHIQMVRKTTYVSLATDGEDVEMCGKWSGPLDLLLFLFFPLFLLCLCLGLFGGRLHGIWVSTVDIA